MNFPFLNNLFFCLSTILLVQRNTVQQLQKIVHHQGNRNFSWYTLMLLLSIVQITNEYILFGNMLLTEIYQ